MEVRHGNFSEEPEINNQISPCLTSLSTIFQLYRGGRNHRPVACH